MKAKSSSYNSICTGQLLCPRLCARFQEYSNRSETKPVPAFRELTDKPGSETVTKYHMKLLNKVLQSPQVGVPLRGKVSNDFQGMSRSLQGRGKNVFRQREQDVRHIRAWEKSHRVAGAQGAQQEGMVKVER